MRKGLVPFLVLAAVVASVPAADAAPKSKPRSVTSSAKPKKKKPSAKPTAKTSSPPAPPMLIDCKKLGTNAQCQRPEGASGGSIGTGPRIDGSSGFPEIGEGFIDGNRIVTAVEMGSQFDDLGAIFGIDLTTGNRTVLSGKIDDPATGPVSVGTGPELGNVRAVAQAGSTWVAIAAKSSTSPVRIVRIDPRTGDRTLEYTSERALTCTGSTAKLQLDFLGGIAAGPDGTAYVTVGNISNAVGVLAFKNGACSVVTMSGAPENFEGKGSGPTISSMDRYRSMHFEGGKIWALHGMSNSLMTIDVTTGNRARVSSSESSTRVGAGDRKLGYKALALDKGGKAWTAGPWAGHEFIVTDVVTGTGTRTGHDATSGPADSTKESSPVIWVHPTRPMLVMSLERAFVVFDPATGNSNILSM